MNRPNLISPPDLEEKYLPKDNWKTESFRTPDTGREIFYRTAFIDNAKAIVFILPGLSEYGEKYIETTHQLNDEGFDVVVIDWAYQGLSTRYTDNRHKRSSDGIDQDIADLHQLIKTEINSPLPHLMLAHSMGGNYGLRYVTAHSDIFKAIALSAPMLGIAGICKLRGVASLLLKFLSPIKNHYVPGGHDWNVLDRHDIVNSVFSHDKKRREVHNAWMTKNPDLQIGSVTYKWVNHNLASICYLAQTDILKNIKTPVFLGLAEKDKVVDNDSIIHAAKHLPHANLEFLNDSAHEILMERDEIRDVFLTKTIELFKDNI